METLADKIRRFNNKYTVSFDPAAILEEARIDAVFDSYKFTKKDENKTRQNTYLKALLETLNESLNAETKIQSAHIYDLSRFDIVKFVREFEEIMNESNMKLAEPKKRKPYEGFDFETLIDKIKSGTKAYDKPLYSIWANKVVDGKIFYKDLKKVTDIAVKNVENQEKFRYGSVDRSDLANVVYAHEAMFRVCQSRGFWWKAFHLYQNYKEHQYLDSLSTRVSEYINKNYPIDDISNTVSNSMMADAYKNIEYTLGWEKDQVLKEKIQNELKEEEERKRKISSVSEQLNPIIDDPSFSNKLTESIVENLPKCKWSSNIQKNVLNAHVTAALINEAKNANVIFDAGIISGKAPQDQIASSVKLVFGKAYSLVSALGYIDPSDQLLAAQKITDTVMKKASPAALQPELYEKFTNGYVLNNPEEFYDITGMDGTEPAFVKAKSDFMKENVRIEEIDSNKAEKAPRVSDQPIIDANVLNK